MLVYFNLWFLPILLNVLILLWWRFSCYNRYETKFPSRGHILLITLATFIPIFGIILCLIIIGIYIGARLAGEIHLKNNKFNKYWFDVK